jgi:hypothetical protein
MTSLSIQNQIIHEQLVDSVMHIINDGMKTDAVCTTTRGPWRDRGKEVLAAIGIGESPKLKAERRAKQHILYVEERKRFEEEKANQLLREKHRLQHGMKMDAVCLPPWQQNLYK